MLGVLEGFFIIFSVIAVGFLLAHTKVIPTEQHRLVLNRVAFFAATPALMVKVVSESHPDALFSPVIAVLAAATAVTFVGCSWCLQRFAGTDRPTTTIGAAAASYVNSNSIGLPVGMYVLSNVAYVAPLLVLQMVVLTPIILALISEVPPHSSRLRGVFGSVARALGSPIVVGAALGLVLCLTQSRLPEVLEKPVGLLGGASIPLILLSFGASLHNSAPLTVPRWRRATLIALLWKIAWMPLLALGLGLLFGLARADLYSVVILSCLPAAQNVYNYAATYQQGTVVARDTILISTFVALPAMLLVAVMFGQ